MGHRPGSKNPGSQPSCHLHSNVATSPVQPHPQATPEAKWTLASTPELWAGSAGPGGPGCGLRRTLEGGAVSWGRGLPQVRLGAPVSLKQVPPQEGSVNLVLREGDPVLREGSEFLTTGGGLPARPRSGDAKSQPGVAAGRYHPSGGLGLLQPDREPCTG